MRLFLFLLATACFAQSPDFDILIRGGRIADGTGNPTFYGDIGIRNGRIAALGRINGTATRTITAIGFVVAPGFIDIHNHSDYTILTDGNAEGMIRQGVTSMILGEGDSAAPAKGSEGWEDFRGYFDRLLRQGISTNIGSYVGSSRIWTLVHGEKAGPITAEERRKMQQLVRESMEQGALGVASSLSGPPGAWIDTDTLVAMCQAAAPYGGIYSTHMRNEGLGVFHSVDEALEIGHRAGVPVDIIHLKIAEHSLWGKMPELIAKIARRAPTDSRWKRTSIPTGPGRTTSRPSFRRGRTRAATKPCSAACATNRFGLAWSAKFFTESPIPPGTITTPRREAGRGCCWFPYPILRTRSSKASG